MDAIVDNFRLALSTFWGHRLRSLLTLLGIVIGAATVVSMMALLEGLRLKVNDDLSGLGSNGFQIQKFPNGFGNIDFERLSKRPNLTVEDREDILRHAPDVVAVTGSGTGTSMSTHSTGSSVATVCPVKRSALAWPSIASIWRRPDVRSPRDFGMKR